MDLMEQFKKTNTFKYFYSTLLHFDESLNCFVATEKWRDKEAELLTAAWWMFIEFAKAQAVPYESCSIKSHEIIINETKNELIDSYDIAKEDEYLLESLVYRGVCIGKAQAVPESITTELQIDWGMECPKCNHNEATCYSTAAQESGYEFMNGDAVSCNKCGNIGEMDAQGEDSDILWNEDEETAKNA